MCAHTYRTGYENDSDGWSPFKIVCPADGAVKGAAVYFAFPAAPAHVIHRKTPANVREKDL